MGAVSPGELGFGRLFDRVRDAVVVAEVATGTIVLWNAAARRLLGFEADEAIGKPIEILIPERYREAHRRALVRYRETGHGKLIDAERPIEIQALHRDGHEIPIELTLSPIDDQPEGAPRRVMAIIRDITDRVERLRLQQERFEQLRQIDRLKTEFLGVLSHELRTPINAITGFGSILEDEVAGALNAEQHAYLRRLLEGADVLLRLVNDLLDMAQIQAGRIALRREPTHLDEIVRDVLGGLTTSARCKRIKLESAVPADLPVLDVDIQRVSQVVRNLVDNGIKFAPEEGWVRVDSKLVNGDVEIAVTDNGPGIAAEDFGRLFRPFSQLDMSLTRVAGGVGLGLSIAKALVEAHGGSIGVESAPGRGSRFWFRLPVRSPEAGPAGAPGDRPGAAGRIEISDESRGSASSRDSRISGSPEE